MGHSHSQSLVRVKSVSQIQSQSQSQNQIYAQNIELKSIIDLMIKSVSQVLSVCLTIHYFLQSSERYHYYSIIDIEKSRSVIK